MMKIRTYGKCILAGEHSLLRGGSALLFPLKYFYFDVFYQEGDFEVTLGENFLEKKYLKDYRDCIQKFVGQRKGRFHLECSIPVAAGLGSSAAFCLGVSRIFLHNGWISETQVPDMSLKMENEFHGQSSGADIRLVEKEKPLLFKNFNDFEIFKPTWNPYLYLHDTGIRSETKKCVWQVQKQNNPHIDQKMKESVALCVKALQGEKNLSLLGQGIRQAGECFEEWGLCPSSVQKQILDLKKKGALAIKPTGSGRGGFLISLWNKPQAGMISVFGQE